MHNVKSQSGFTLIEMVMVIVITGILGTMVAVFIRSPVQTYFDTVRRAEMTDAADTAARRMSRDIQNALPNSVRLAVVGADSFLEFIPVTGAGRYCAEAGTGAVLPSVDCLNILDPASGADNSFFVLGNGVPVAAGDSVVVNNLGVPGVSSAYDTAPLTSRRLVAAANVLPFTTIAFTPNGTPFQGSPNQRFQVIATPVTYGCEPDPANPANGALYRYENYPIQVAQPTTSPPLPPAAVRATLVTNVTACSFNLAPGFMSSTGLVTINLTLTYPQQGTGGGGESVFLQHQVNVNNTP